MADRIALTMGDEVLVPCAPLTVCLAVSGACNLRCRHCSSRTIRGSSELDTDQWLAIIDQLAAARVFKVSLFGGEPLMRPDIHRLLERLDRSQIQVTLTTNGTLITRECAEMLARHRIAYYRVSLDGSRKNHDFQRQPGSYDRTVRGMRNLIDTGAHVIVSMTVTRHNKTDIGFMARVARSWGAARMRYGRMRYYRTQSGSMDDLMMDPAEYRDAVARVGRVCETYPGFVTGIYASRYEQRGRRDRNSRQGSPARFSCKAGITSCAVRPDGWVSPCHGLFSDRIANAVTTPFLDIWRRSKRLHEFRKHVAESQERRGECGSCELREDCYWGECHVHASVASGISADDHCWKRGVPVRPRQRSA